MKSLLARLRDRLGRFNLETSGTAHLRADLDATRQKLDELAGAVDTIRHFAESARDLSALAASHRPVGARIRVMFLIHHKDALYSHVDLIRRMREDRDFDVIVASIAHRYPGDDTYRGEDDVHAALDHFAIPHIRLASRDPWRDLMWVRSLAPDLIIRQSQWEIDVPAPFRTYETRFARLALIPYEIANLVENPKDEWGFNSAVDNYLHRAAWAVFCVSEWWKAHCVVPEAPATGGIQYEPTGHPKVQALLARMASIADKERPFTVLWSAHHSIGEDWINFGMFPQLAPVMIECARANPEWDFVLSLHPALTHQLEADANLAQLRDEFLALPNTRFFAGGGDYAAEFVHSDVLVCDGVSWLLEYQLTAKPVVFVERPDHAPFNAMGRAMREGTHVISDPRDLPATLTYYARGGTNPATAGAQRTCELIQSHTNSVDEIVHTIKRRMRAEGWTG